jgi:mono/diheme cytochrome c family protein
MSALCQQQTFAEQLFPVTLHALDSQASTPKGQLKSPYADFASVAEEGHRKYMAGGCNGCHGGGGGGMAMPLTSPCWIYGDDDDALFRLITLGTGKLVATLDMAKNLLRERR